MHRGNYQTAEELPSCETRRYGAGYNEELQQVLATSVWAASCRSWYKTESGKIIGIYPGFSCQYIHELRKPRFEDYIIR